MDEQYGYTRQDIEKIYGEIYKQYTCLNAPSSQPHAILLGGIPGAGKSSVYKSNDFDNYVFVSADDFRRYHPHSKAIAETNKSEYAAATQPFANEITERLIRQLSDQNYNVIIEGTLRNVNTQINTCNMLKHKGYDVDLNVVTCDACEAWKSTLTRAELQKELGAVQRYVDIDQFDFTANQIPMSLDTAQISGSFDKIVLRNREGEKLFDSSRTDNPTVLASETFEKETNIEQWNQKYNLYKEDYQNRIGETTKMKGPTL